MAQPHPAVAAVRSAVAAGVADLPPGSLVLVACSGGPDSLALAAGLAFVAERGGRTSRVGSGPVVERSRGADVEDAQQPGRRAGRHTSRVGSGPVVERLRAVEVEDAQEPRGAGLRAGAVVVDHRVQAGSAAVAARAGAACEGLGLDPVLVRAVHVGGAGGPEAAARRARYAALEAAARETGAAAVLLGHTLDDQAETVLLGLARGSGARSLAGMAPVRGPFRRPLLGLRRADTLAACAALGLEPWHDPTNDADGGPLRSRVRGVVLPLLERELGPGVAEALARTAAQLRADSDALDAQAADLLVRAAAETDDDGRDDDGHHAGARHTAGHCAAGHRLAGHRGLDVDALASSAPAVRLRALRLAALAAGAGALRAEHVAALDALVTRWHGQGPVALPGGVVGHRACGRLFLGGPAPRDEVPAAADDTQHD